MTPRRWTDEMLDRQAEQIAEDRAHTAKQIAEDRAHMAKQIAEERARTAEQIAEERARMAEQIAEDRARMAEQIAEDRARMDGINQQIEALLEAQRMLVEIYQQEHEARVEADRRFNRFIERQEQLNQHLTEAVEELRQLVRFSRENGSRN